MRSNNFLHLSLLSLFSLSLCLPQQTSSTNNHYSRSSSPPPPPSPGLCSAVEQHGYKCQEFQVTTDDDYILNAYRIPEGRADGGYGMRPPVLLQHGILMDGMTWVVGSPKESVAMIFADNGFDVWISNVRGTRFSRRHLKLDPKNTRIMGSLSTCGASASETSNVQTESIESTRFCPKLDRVIKYWDWTWADLAVHDLPAIVDLIFKTTGSKIHYVGHSMGTLMALAALLEGKLNNVKSAALLSPIAHLTHLEAALPVVAAKVFLAEIGTMFGLAEFNPIREDEIVFLKSLTAYQEIDYTDLTMTSLTGKNCCLNESTIHNFVKKHPQPTSTKNLVHFSQSIRHGTLSKYDYGNALLNMHHYGKTKPPVYDLTKIEPSFPLFIGHGGEDAMSDVKDVAALLDDLKSHDKQKLQVLFIKNYAHLDFVMGMNARDILYNHIVDFFTTNNN